MRGPFVSKQSPSLPRLHTCLAADIGGTFTDVAAFDEKTGRMLLGKAVSTPTFARGELRAGNRIDGPALIEECASTTGVLPGDKLSVDVFGNLMIEVGKRIR